VRKAFHRCICDADIFIGHGSFGIIRKVKRKSDGYVRLH
jgi:hypothetical protein